MVKLADWFIIRLEAKPMSDKRHPSRQVVGLQGDGDARMKFGRRDVAVLGAEHVARQKRDAAAFGAERGVGE